MQNSVKQEGKGAEIEALNAVADEDIVMSTELALQIIDALVSDVRGGDLTKGLSGALKSLVSGFGVERGLIWRVIGAQLTVTQEYSTRADVPSLVGTSFNPQKSTAVVLNLLALYSDLTVGGSLVITKADSDWQIFSEVAEPLCSSLLVLLSAQFFSGFVALQCEKERGWSAAEISTLEKVASLMSVLLNDAQAIERLTADAIQLEALSKILDWFLQKEGSTAEITIRALTVVAEILGFRRAILYFHRAGDLIPQGSVYLSSTGPLVEIGLNERTLKLDDLENPVVQSFQSGLEKVIDQGFMQLSVDEKLENHPAIIMPLIDEQDVRLGAFVLWERLSDSGFTPQDQECLLWIAGQLSRCISSTF